MAAVGAIVADHYSYPLNGRRQRMLDKIVEATDENTKADAIDAALNHYLKDKANREEHWRRFPPELLELLNTPEMKVSYYPKVR